MNDKLSELIREARRELRRSSGIPPTPDEQLEERRKAELETMEMFVYEKIGVNGLFELSASTVWTEDGAVAQFTVNEKTFFLRKDKEDYRLTASETLGERELLRLNATDPQFGNIVLAAIGDTLDLR
jgi:hypothetical protein